jgi:hypothetical protein
MEVGQPMKPVDKMASIASSGRDSAELGRLGLLPWHQGRSISARGALCGQEARQEDHGLLRTCSHWLSRGLEERLRPDNSVCQRCGCWVSCHRGMSLNAGH